MNPIRVRDLEIEMKKLQAKVANLEEENKILEDELIILSKAYRFFCRSENSHGRRKGKSFEECLRSAIR